MSSFVSVVDRVCHDLLDGSLLAALFGAAGLLHRTHLVLSKLASHRRHQNFGCKTTNQIMSINHQ